MAQPFEVELEELTAKFARELSHEVTALILRRLGIEPGAVRPPSGGNARSSAARSQAREVSPKRAIQNSGVKSAKGAKGATGAKAMPTAQPSRRTRATLEERAATLNEVERIVASSEGLSAGDIERRSSLSRASVAAALKALKDEGRLFMGGTKRFARYAMSQPAADKASRDARGGTGDE